MNAAIPIAAVLTVSVWPLRDVIFQPFKKKTAQFPVFKYDYICVIFMQMYFSTDICGSCELAQCDRLRSVSRCGFRVPLPLPHPGHAPLPAFQCFALHSQSSREVIDSSHPKVFQYGALWCICHSSTWIFKLIFQFFLPHCLFYLYHTASVNLMSLSFNNCRYFLFLTFSQCAETGWISWQCRDWNWSWAHSPGSSKQQQQY